MQLSPLSSPMTSLLTVNFTEKFRRKGTYGERGRRIR